MNFFNFFHRKGSDDKIKYVVRGTSDGYNITYKCPDEGITHQKSIVKKGWTHTFTANEGDYFYFSAQANSRNAEVEVRVYQNGKLYKRITKNGDFPLVQASGSLH